MVSLPIAPNLPQTPRQNLPTMYDLPSEHPEDPGLPDEFHLWQSRVLEYTFVPGNQDPDLVFSAIDLNLYYDLNHPGWYKRPDWFGAIGVSRFYEGRELRLSYVIWQERVSPFVVVELLSPGTEDEDLGQTMPQAGKPPTKWQVYEQILQVPYYIIFSRYTDRVQAFRWREGRYEAIAAIGDRILMPELDLSLGLWRGSYKGLNRLWLRWLTLTGELIPLPEERTSNALERLAAAERRIAEAEQAERTREQVAERRIAEAERAREQAERRAELAERAREQTERRAEQAERRAEQAERRAEQAEQRAMDLEPRVSNAEQEAAAAQQQVEQLISRLRQLGLDLD